MRTTHSALINLDSSGCFNPANHDAGSAHAMVWRGQAVARSPLICPTFARATASRIGTHIGRCQTLKPCCNFWLRNTAQSHILRNWLAPQPEDKDEPLGEIRLWWAIWLSCRRLGLWPSRGREPGTLSDRPSLVAQRLPTITKRRRPLRASHAPLVQSSDLGDAGPKSRYGKVTTSIAISVLLFGKCD